MQIFSMKETWYIWHTYRVDTMFLINAMLLANAWIPEKVSGDDTVQQEERNVLRTHYVH